MSQAVFITIASYQFAIFWGWGLPNQASIQKQSKVEQSQDRLEQAVARLETIIDATGVRPSELVQNTDIEALKEEIKQLRQENIALRRVNDQVSSRLDSAIGRLRTVIGE